MNRCKQRPQSPPTRCIVPPASNSRMSSASARLPARGARQPPHLVPSLTLLFTWWPMGKLRYRPSASDTVPPGNARFFLCACCRKFTVVCQPCDRGQRYCGKECSLKARRASQRRSGAFYQRTERGRVNHAARQRAWRERRRAGQMSPDALPLATPPPVEPAPPAAPPPSVAAAPAHLEASSALPAPASQTPLAAGPGKRRRRSSPSWPEPPPMDRCLACGGACSPYLRRSFLSRKQRRPPDMNL